MTEYNVDPLRTDIDETGVYVRAKFGGSWGSYDIAHLDAESLLAWLRSQGGDNPWAEDVVGILLGHGALHLLTAGERSGEQGRTA